MSEHRSNEVATRAGWVRAVGLLGLVLVLTACSQGAPSGSVPPSSAASAEPPPTPVPSRTATPAPTSPSPTPPSPTSPSPTSPSPTTPSCTDVPAELSLDGDEHHAFAFAPLADPSEVTVEGRVSRTEAWSTSKVLVVAAYLDRTVGGDPERVDAETRRLITAALSRSDGDAVVAVRSRIDGPPGAAMTAVLRAIGDRTTVAPEQAQGNMDWSLREQVRFVAALADGAVVSKATSAYLLQEMRPIEAHAWGLGTIGATAFKGGWLRQDTATRQLGIVGGYAVAISTDDGPAVRQTDGDSAHVREINRVARTLRGRLAFEQGCG